ncbi:MAG: PAS domain S-box protein, partial [Leptolyngbyaceae bacterium]|nr:PAS domain S-box protein [Leptolyngbyaceae bacterium]
MFSRGIPKRLSLDNIPLRWVLIVPFVLQIAGAVGLVGYLSYRSGQTAVENLANQVMNQATSRIHDHLDISLQTQQQAIAVNHRAVQQGILNPKDFEQLQNHFWQQINLFPSLSGMGFANERGEEIGYGRLLSQEIVEKATKLAGQKLEIGILLFSEVSPTHPGRRSYYLVDDRGRAKQQFYTFAIDNRTTPWYRAGKAAQTQTWSPIFVYQVAPILGMSAVAPVYDAAGKFQGILGNHLALSEIGTFLSKLNFSPSGQTFILERSGDLVATSTLETVFVKYKQKPPTRLPATQSQDARTRAIATYLQQQYPDLGQIQVPLTFQVAFEGNQLFAQVEPYRDPYGLDWLLVTAIPASDFMAEIQANTNWTILLCGLTLLGVTGLGVLTAQWITQPILRLSQANRTFAKGNWGEVIPETSAIAELKLLTRTFNQMSAQLQSSFERRINEQTETQYRLLLETIPVGIFRNDLQGNATYANSKKLQMAGITLEKYLEVGWLETIHPDDRDWVQAQWLAFIEQAQVDLHAFYQLECRKQRPDGAIIWVLIQAVGERNPAGKLTGYIGTATDISDRKQLTLDRIHIEESLRQSEARQGALISALPDLIMIVNREGIYVDFISTNYFKVIGETGDFVGTRVDESLPKPLAQQRMDAVAMVFQTGSIQIYEQEICVEGSIQTEEVRVVPYQENEVLVLVRDISKAKREEVVRKQIEANLRESRASLQVAQRVAHVGSWEYNPASYKITWSEELFRIFGLDPTQSEPSYEDYLQLIYPEDREKLHQAVEQALITGSSYEIEHRLIRPDGSIRYVLGRGETQIDAQGKVVKLFGTGLDITDRKQIEEALRESEARTRGILMAIPDIILIVNKEGIYLEVIRTNPTKDLIPKDINPVGKHLTEILPLEVALRDIQAIQRALATGTQQINEQQVWINGRLQYEELCIVAIREDAVLIIVRDISDRKQIEIALRNNEAMFRSLSESSPIGIFMTDGQGKSTYANPRALEIYGVLAEDPLEEWRNRTHPEDLQRIM